MSARVLYLTCVVLSLLSLSLSSKDVTDRALCAADTGHDVDCSSLLTIGDRSCLIKYYTTNSVECSHLDISHYSGSKFNLGDVALKPYMWDYGNEHIYNYTLLNITFSNTKWNRMKFRFEASKDPKTQQRKNHCREIIVSGSVSDQVLIPSLSYDCHWSDQDHRYENESYVFEYVAESEDNNDYGKFMFKVPSVQSVFGVNSIPFIYIDLTNKKTMDVHFVPVNENHSSVYSLEICIQKEENSLADCKVKENVTIDSKEVIYYYTPHCSGLHIFQVTHSTCERNCSNATILKIYFEKSSIIYTILWNVLLICGIFGFCFSVWWIIKRHQNFTPKILIIHPYADKSHTQVINVICKYFAEELKWEVSWNKDIELTQHGDPYIWCLEGFMSSNSIIYIDKPSYISDNSSADIGSIHMHLGDIFFKMYKSNKKKTNMKFYNIMLDSHSPDKISSDVRDFNTFYLPVEWISFIHSIKRHSWIQKLFKKVPSLRDSISGRELIKVLDQLSN